MKYAIVVLACILPLGCASSSAPVGDEKSVQVAAPDITFIQIVGPADQNFPSGSIQVQYGIRVGNNAMEDITLRSIELSSVGTTGPYVLKRDTFFFRKKIDANGNGDVTWWATAIARGNPFALDAQAPVSVRATLLFDSAKGSFRKVVFRDFSQSGSGARQGN